MEGGLSCHMRVCMRTLPSGFPPTAGVHSGRVLYGIQKHYTIWPTSQGTYMYMYMYALHNYMYIIWICIVYLIHVRV